MSTGIAGALADGDRLLDGSEHLRPLVADVRRVEPAVPLDHPAELDQVVGRDGQLAGAGEHGREPSAPSRIASSSSAFIASSCAGLGPVERIALDAAQQRAEPDIAGDVDGDAPALSSASK